MPASDVLLKTGTKPTGTLSDHILTSMRVLEIGILRTAWSGCRNGSIHHLENPGHALQDRMRALEMDVALLRPPTSLPEVLQELEDGFGCAAQTSRMPEMY